MNGWKNKSPKLKFIEIINIITIIYTFKKTNFRIIITISTHTYLHHR